MLAGFLFKTSSLTYPQAFFILGIAISVCAPFALTLRFSESDEKVTKKEIEARLSGTYATVTAS